MAYPSGDAALERTSTAAGAVRLTRLDLRGGPGRGSGAAPVPASRSHLLCDKEQSVRIESVEDRPARVADPAVGRVVHDDAAPGSSVTVWRGADGTPP
ncbi:hypothetical protein [Streptomyces sp. NPDC058629]|uniref:hypothetical protein n=1 Tax=Streptomyces sp. NPDC058629 TaxID=3346565 RepID=UPI003659FC3B